MPEMPEYIYVLQEDERDAFNRMYEEQRAMHAELQQMTADDDGYLELLNEFSVRRSHTKYLEYMVKRDITTWLFQQAVNTGNYHRLLLVQINLSLPLA